MLKLKHLILVLTGIMLLAWLTGCTPSTGTTTGSDTTSTLTMIGFLVVLFVIFYFLMIRPQRKRQQEQQKMLQALKKGDRIVTIGGIYGEVQSVDENNVVIKVENGTLRIARNAVATRTNDK